MIPCAAILAGGKGTRLRSVLGSKPKALAEISGRPFLYYLLDQLEKAGLKLVILCTGIGSTEIQKELGNWYHDIKLVYSEEQEPLGTAGALRNAIPYFNSPFVLVLNGDSYCRTPMIKFLNGYQLQSREAGMLTVKAQETERFGRVNSSAGGRIESFGASPTDGKPGYINAGAYLLPLRLLGEISEKKAASLENDFFPKWAQEKRLYAFPVEAPFIDIGTPESYKDAQTFFGAKVSV